MRNAVLASMLALAMVSVGLTAAPGGGRADTTPTFTKDVAPILYENCASCHRKGDIAPMSLLTYQEVRPWSKAIREVVVSREMPPWLADPAHSLKMRNERRLSQQQIDTLVAWVVAGAPKGNDADLPPPPTFADGWSNGEPDYILEMPIEFEVPAEGELDVLDFYTKIPFDTDHFAEVLELRPSNPALVHHAGAYVVDIPEGSTIIDGVLVKPDGNAERVNEEQREDRGGFQDVFNQLTLDGASKLISYVPGRGLERHRPGTAKRLAAGKYVKFAMHYNSIGKAATDRSRLGIWFNTRPVTHEVLTRQGGNPVPTDRFGHDIYIVEGDEVVSGVDEKGKPKRAKIPNIPPYQADWKIVGITPITEPVTLFGLSPHMHLRGKSLKWIVTWPDGREQTILDVPKFDFNWQIHYELEEPLRLPAGSKITAVGIYDNSPRNRWNPAPHLEVYWAEQSWDEMYQAFTEYTVDSQDLTKQSRSTTEQQRQ